VAIARALVQEPDILLADEPTGALDSQSTEDILELFSTLHRSGKTIIVVTHEADVGARARRTIRLRDGLIVEDSSRGGFEDSSQTELDGSARGSS
jgi:putative ABC transport system ATP-binding protein